MDRATASSNREPRRATLRQRVFEALRERIMQGEYGADQQLPSESVLMQDYGVSRVTIRLALRDLVDLGLIHTQQGRGSFVSAPRATYNLSALLGFNEATQGRPFAATSKVLSARPVRATRDVARALRLPRSASALEVHRVRCLNARPVSVEISYFPEEIGARLCGHDLSQDIFPLLERLGIGLDRSLLLIEARGCPADVAVDLELDRGFPILQLNRLTLDTLGRPVDYEQIYCRGDAYQYRVELRRSPS
jgi:GntR family transcriptional regulator